MREDELNELMGCDCDYDIRPHDLYFKDHKIVAIAGIQLPALH